MVNRNSRGAEFRSAIASSDPFRVASVLSLPPIASSRQRNGEEGPAPTLGKQPESLQENGLDWSPVLTAWLDACEAAEAVRKGLCRAFVLRDTERTCLAYLVDGETISLLFFASLWFFRDALRSATSIKQHFTRLSTRSLPLRPVAL
jgi:hypothetical protein